jgi:phosphoribosylformimino-5-aminoimidazole carboxamide ribotide isomerase
VDSFVYTDADRDGALEGPDLAAVRAVAEAVRGRFLYAGGIGGVEHLRALRDLRQVNLAGVVVGKALYEGRFTVAEGQAALDGRG